MATTKNFTIRDGLTVGTVQDIDENGVWIGPASSYVGPTGSAGSSQPPSPQGPQGPAGAQGSYGDLGPLGPQGVKGPQGNVGPQGPAGPSGEQGPQGGPGPTGNTGPQGTSAAGPAGPQGPGGSIGNAGPQGPAGPIGPQGPQGSTGNTGPQGPQGAIGPQGPQGPQGPEGDVGPQGAIGQRGVQPATRGPQGPQGPQGNVGPQGVPGPRGPQGPQGAQGPQGGPGPTGPQGSTPTTTTPNVDSLGINTPAPPQGNIYATGNITGYYSDRRLKENIKNIDNSIQKVQSLTGIYFTQNKFAEKFGYNDYSRKIGLIAQQVQNVLPEAIQTAAFDADSKGDSISGEHYITINYMMVIPLMIEAIKEQQKEINTLLQKLEGN